MAEAAAAPGDWATEGGEAFRDGRGRVVTTYHDVALTDDIRDWLATGGFDTAKFQVTRVRRVQGVKQLYHVRQTLREDGGGATTTLYHGTTARDLSLAEGLDDRLSPGGLFGSGLYFTPTLDKADRYTGRGQTRRVVVCEVALGRIYHVAEDHTLHTLRREPRGYDSVRGVIRGNVEHVVYDRRRVRMTYIIDYKHVETKKEEETAALTARAPGVVKAARGVGHAGKSVH